MATKNIKRINLNLPVKILSELEKVRKLKATTVTQIIRESVVLFTYLYLARHRDQKNVMITVDGVEQEILSLL